MFPFIKWKNIIDKKKFSICSVNEIKEIDTLSDKIPEIQQNQYN